MPMRVMRAVGNLGERQVKLKWVLPAYLLIFVIAYGLFVANTTYSRDKADEAQFATARLTYEATVQEYETCTRRVESRTEIRGMFAATFDAIEENSNGAGANAFLDKVRARLDTNYPPADPAECVPPGPPPERD